jgi:DNA repair exonuclease SbcCD ATPase subunit
MIKFRKVRWKNFLSTGAQFTEVQLDRSTTTLIIGENGAGKSTILDAICFSLFNKGFRNISKGQLINSVNGKQCLVEIEFSIGSKDYKVIRGVKPNIFEIHLNGEMLNQDAAARDYQKYLEEHVLKLNYKSFTQIVILGSASFTPFMQLSSSNRKDIIEDLLDIRIFSAMNDVLKDKMSELKTKISDFENRIELGKSKAKIQQDYIKTLEDDKNKKVAEIEKIISDTRIEINAHASDVEALQSEIQTLEEKIADEEDNIKKRNKLTILYDKLLDKIKKAQEEIAFYNDHDVCPTCSQQIGEDTKGDHIHGHELKIDEVTKAIEDLDRQIEEIRVRMDKIDEVKKDISSKTSGVVNANNKIITAQDYISKLQKDLDAAAENKGNIDEEKAKLKVIAKEVVAMAEDKAKVLEDKQYHEIASVLLKDTGIKTTIIKQYLPAINKLVNKYLQAMEFFVSFELDESFDEVIKSRHRDEFSYASFSEGEKQRIDLALLFTWRTIAKMKNSASTNLLMLDEVFDSSLDVNGTDFVMNLLNTLGEETNVFVISHKGDQLFDKFRSVLKFEKYQNFSRIAK